MTQEEIASYKEQMFSSNGHSSTQSPTPAPTNTDAPPAAEPPVVDPPTVQPAVVVEVKPDAEPPATPPVESKPVDDNVFVKERLGYDTWELAKAEIESLKKKAETPAEIKYANEQSKLLHEAITSGNRKEVLAILRGQEELEELSKIDNVDTNSAASIVKAAMKFKHKDLTPKEIDYKFNKQFGVPSKPVKTEIEDDDEYNAKLAQWEEIVKDKEMELIIEAKVARPELEKFKSEIVLPKIKSESQDEAYLNWKKEQEQAQALDQETKQAYSKFTPKDVSMVFKFNDEASKLAFDVAYEPDKESFDKAIANASDMQTYFANYYAEDGSPKREEFLRDLYAGQNITKIVSEAIKQATNQTKAWFLKNQKNIGDGTQRNFVPVQPTEIDNLRQAVFGK